MCVGTEVMGVDVKGCGFDVHIIVDVTNWDRDMILDNVDIVDANANCVDRTVGSTLS